MPQLVIGHTTHDSTAIWVRGDSRARRVRVDLELLDGKVVASQRTELKPEDDYTATLRFESQLAESTPYRVLARFGAEDAAPLRGGLRTFPKPGSEHAFRFLHGSCNLSTARLTTLGSMAVGLLGGVAARSSLRRSVEDWDVRKWPRWLPRSRGTRLLAQRIGAWLALRVPGAIAATTRFELPEPLLPSPFEQLVQSIAQDDPSERPAFMIHAGDQIYFDVDFPTREPRQDEYRRNYRQAWFEDESTAALLRSLPHYMILDDHEILDSFGTDPDDEERRHAPPARAAYAEYVDARQPSRRGEFFYAFQHGNSHFFVLDTRTERSREQGEMIGEQQLGELEAWLRKQARENPNELKFVVSSVPFVAQLRAPGLGSDGARREDEQSDKWSGRAWQQQRERILATVYQHGVERLVFLVGDMHCAYHARMRIGPPRRCFTVHELAGGPIYQLLYARRGDFYARYASSFMLPDPEEPVDGGELEVPWTSTLEAFHGAAPSVLELRVTPETDRTPLELGWQVLRTRAKAQRRLPAAERGEARADAAQPAGESGVPARAPIDPAPLRGRIRFHRLPAQEDS